MAEVNVDKTVELAQLGQYDGDHHKLWVIDQIVREVLGEKYDEWVKEYEGPEDEDGYTEWTWETGIAP